MSDPFFNLELQTGGPPPPRARISPSDIIRDNAEEAAEILNKICGTDPAKRQAALEGAKRNFSTRRPAVAPDDNILDSDARMEDFERRLEETRALRAEEYLDHVQVAAHAANAASAVPAKISQSPMYPLAQKFFAVAVNFDTVASSDQGCCRLHDLFAASDSLCRAMLSKSSVADPVDELLSDPESNHDTGKLSAARQKLIAAIPHHFQSAWPAMVAEGRLTPEKPCFRACLLSLGLRLRVIDSFHAKALATIQHKAGGNVQPADVEDILAKSQDNFIAEWAEKYSPNFALLTIDEHRNHYLKIVASRTADTLRSLRRRERYEGQDESGDHSVEDSGMVPNFAKLLIFLENRLPAADYAFMQVRFVWGYEVRELAGKSPENFPNLLRSFDLIREADFQAICVFGKERRSFLEARHRHLVESSFLTSCGLSKSEFKTRLLNAHTRCCELLGGITSLGATALFARQQECLAYLKHAASEILTHHSVYMNEHSAAP